MNKLIILISIIISIGSIESSGFTPNLIGSIQVEKPGFVDLIPGADSFYHVAISSFNGAPFSQDYVFFVANYSTYNSTIIKQLDNTKLVWPNELSYTNQTIISSSVDPFGGLFAPGGFLVPSKTDGAIWYYPFTSKDRSFITDGKPIELTSNPQGGQKWFYHRVKRVDVTGDGILDLVTCRSYKPVVGQTKVELVVYVYDNQTQTYTEKVILNDVCDVFFDITDVDNDGRVEIIAAGFFISQLAVIYSDDKNNSFLNGNVHIVKIDTNGGQFFDVRVEDLDLDSDLNKEILVTNHQGNKASVKGSLFYYKLNGDVRSGTWTRNLIYNNFPVLKGGINQAAPGGAKAFRPQVNDTNSRPYILVSGDGAEKGECF